MQQPIIMDAIMEEAAMEPEASGPPEETPAPPTTMESSPSSQVESSPPSQPPAQEAPAPLAKRLEDIVELMQRINQLLDELSLERRAEVSSRQWETWEEFKSSPARGLKPAKFWQNSIFARIYFVDKDLDECFHNVIKHGSLFFNHLNSIYIKMQLRGDVPPASKRLHAEDSSGEVQVVACTIAKDPHHQAAAESGVAAGDASNLQQAGADLASRADKGKDYEIIRHSFTNLIRAKIDFDTQFLNFNGILNKSALPEDGQSLPEVPGNAPGLLGQNDLASEHRKATAGNRNKRLRRMAVLNNIGDKTRRRLRRSARIASDQEDSGEVQVIRTLRRRDAE